MYSEKNDSRACTKFLLLLYPYSQASLYVPPHSRRQGSVMILISRLSMQDSIGEDSINNFAAHLFTLFLTALNFDFQIKIINTTKYILEWSCWAYLYKFIEIIISELIYVLYTVLFYNFPDTNIIGWLHWEFTDLSVVTLPVLVQSHIYPCQCFGRISRYIRSVLFGCKYYLNCLAHPCCRFCLFYTFPHEI